MVSYGQNSLRQTTESITIGEVQVSKELYVSCEKSNDTDYFEYSDVSVKEKIPMIFLAKEKKGEFEKLHYAM